MCDALAELLNSSSPNSSSGGPNGSNGNTCTDGSSSSCPGPAPVLEIVDRKTGAVVSGATKDKIVGQKIELMVRANPATPLSNISWTVPGQRVKNYTQSSTTAVRTDLAAADLQGTNLDFYWIAGGSQVIQVSATASGNALSASTTQNVLVPTDVTMTSATGDVDVGDTRIPGDAPMTLHYGSLSKVGIQWTCKAKGPSGDNGRIAGTQITNSVRTITSNAGVTKSNDTGGTWMLDTTVPYAAAVGINPGVEATWTSNDNPSSELKASLSKVTANDQFRMFFMYKPSGDSIWVTLMRLDWHWAGVTTRKGAPRGTANDWNPVTGKSSDNNPSGVATTELPVWTANVTSIVWK